MSDKIRSYIHDRDRRMVLIRAVENAFDRPVQGIPTVTEATTALLWAREKGLTAHQQAILNGMKFCKIE